MNKDVLIHVRGLQVLEEEAEQEPIELVIPGQYYFRNGSHFLRYEEHIEEFRETTVNYVKISSKGVEVRKKGLINVHMVFEPGKKNLAYYTTPFGTMEMGILATNVDVTNQEGHLGVKVDYSLDMNEEHVADCFLTIDAQEKTPGSLSL